MANEITLTASVRKNLLSLQNTTRLLDLTAGRLSTGKKVNSALDNPSSFFTARGLEVRAGDLNSRKDGIGQAISLLETTDKALTSITNLVEQGQSIAQQADDAGNTGTFRLSTSVLTTAAVASITAAGTIAASDAFSISVDGGTATTITLTAGATATAFAAQITAVDSGITATFNATTFAIDITATDGSTFLTADVTNTPLNDIGLTDATTTTFGPAGTAAEVAALQADFQTILEQINTLIDDSSYKGKNLLKDTNTQTVKFNEDGTSSLTLTGVSFKVGTTTELFSLGTAAYDFTGNGISTALADTATAINTLRTQSATFGASLGIIQTREEFTTNLVNVLEEGAGKLVNANLEEESANLLSLQTRQALGVQSLSIANQSQQSVLALFR
jgi:flagellin